MLDDHSDHSPRATAFIQRLESGEVAVELPSTAIFETVYALDKLFGKTKHEIREYIQPILGWRNVANSDRNSLVRALDLYVEHNISFADAFHSALAEKRIPPEILSFDKGIDRVRGVQRIEP